jgi:flagellar basal-body rod modification protein FlgD
MENAEFIAQMAQFSTVTGITEISETLKSMTDQMGQFRIATAANLLGSSVLVPGNTARIDSDGEIHGLLDLPSASANTNLLFLDEAGEILHSQELGSQPAGLIGFAWKDIPDEIKQKHPKIRVDAFADMGGGMESLTPSVFADVMAAAVSTTENAVMLDVEDYGQVRADQVMKFRK